LKALKEKIKRLLPDKVYLEIMYEKIMKTKLDLKNPKTFNEKLQWLKLYDRRPEYTKMVDKYEVKQYIKEKIGEEYVIPTLGVWDKFEDIDFDSLSKQFVLKTTHDSGSVIVCRNKDTLDIDSARQKINASLKNKFFYYGREWPYKNVKPRIIHEKYIENADGLIDYKFYCFNGEPKFLYVSQGLEDHSTAKISFLTLDWEFAPFKRDDYESFSSLPQKPACFEKMIEISKILSEGHPFLRVDLYDIDGHVYFSELTFSPCSGFMHFQPAEWDRKVGDYLTLPAKS